MWRCAPINPPVPLATNGSRPVTIWNSVQPSEYRSVRWSTTRAPSHCSGDMYCGVPRIVPVTVCAGCTG